MVRRSDARAGVEIEARVGARIESDHVVEVIASGVDAATSVALVVVLRSR